jgi:Na+/H+-dicarboxylate symporter
MTYSQRILVGLAGGIFTGLFFGERASALKWAADGFVSLLQMMVLPYITVSIVASLGSLDYSQIRRLGLRAAAVIGGLGWWRSRSRSSSADVPLTECVLQLELVEPPTFDFVGLYIPANPFHSLANNVVPAVVLFSVIRASG